MVLGLLEGGLRVALRWFWVCYLIGLGLLPVGLGYYLVG